MEKLGGLCDFISGVTFNKAEAISSPLPGYLPILRAGNIGDALNTKDDFVWVPSDRVSDEQLLQVGDIVMCMSSGSPRVVGKSALLEEQFTGSAGAFCSIIRPKQEEQRKYLAYWFKSECFTRWRDSQARGVNIQNLRASQLKLVEIPLPPLPDQKRIAAILAKADRLRRLRRTARDLSDTYLQSVFLEMFGDPVSNPMGWETGTLGDVMISVKDGPHVSPKYVESGVPFLSTRNVRRGEIAWEDLKFISREQAEGLWSKRGCKPERGDILYTKGGTTGLAKAVDFDEEVAVWVHVAVLKLRQDRVVPVWLENMLNNDYCYHQSQELTFGIVNRDLGLKRMPRIKIYVPPLPLQQEFAHITHKFERLRAQQREAERQAEHLFQTLLHRAFIGEL